MNLASTKIDLAKKILDTNNKEIITYIKAIFENSQENWFDDLPDPIKKSVEKGLKQSSIGGGHPHADVMKKYKKWRNK